MRIMAKLTIKNLFKNKKNFVLCFISVLLSCILLFSVGLAVSTIRQNQINSTIDLYGDYHAIIYNTTLDKESLLDNSHVLKYYYIFQVDGKLYSISDNFGLDLNLKGKLPTNNKEIIISSTTAIQNDLKIGDSFDIDGKRYQVVGVYEKEYLQNINLKDLIFTKEELDNK